MAGTLETTVIGGVSSEYWLDGIKTSAISQSLGVQPALSATSVRTPGQRDNIMAFMGRDAGASMSGLWYNNADMEILGQMFERPELYGFAAHVLVIGRAGVITGKRVRIGGFKPTATNFNDTEGDVISADFNMQMSGHWWGGTLKSHLADGTRPLEPAFADELRYNPAAGPGPFYTPLVNVNSNNATAVLAFIHNSSPERPRPPTHTFNLPAAWQTGTVPASANGKSIAITHKDTKLSTRVLRTGMYLAEIQQQIEALRWPDGFRITVQQIFGANNLTTQMKFTGNLVGSRQDMIFNNDNPNPFRYSVGGYLPHVTAELVTAPSASLDYATIGPVHHPDAPFDVWAGSSRLFAISDTGFDRLGLKISVEGTNNYPLDFNYVLAWVEKGV